MQAVTGLSPRRPGKLAQASNLIGLKPPKAGPLNRLSGGNSLDTQRVNVIVHYIDPSTREFCKTLNGFHSCDWTLFQQSLIKAFRSSIPPHLIKRKKLDHLVEDRSRSRMTCEADVLQYYRDFVCYSLPLVHSHHLTEESRDSAFWYGFHPVDCKILLLRSIKRSNAGNLSPCIRLEW